MAQDPAKQDPKKQDSKKPSLPLHFLRTNDSPRRRSGGNAPPSPEGADGAGEARPAGKTPPVTPPDSGGDRKSGRALAPSGADPYAPDAATFTPGAWMIRTTVLPPQADNRRDAEGNTALMRAARCADFAGLVDLLSIPGTDVAARNAAGQGAYDLLRRAVPDRSCPEFVVISQALFLRTMLDLLIREEHYATVSRGLVPDSPRGLAKKVMARLSSTYANQVADRALPFAAMPSLDFVEAAILAIQ